MNNRVSLPWLKKGMRLSPPAMVLFFVVIPGLLGFMLGATRAGVALYFPWGIGLLFWSVSSVAVWACLYASSGLVAFALRRHQPPLWLILAVGAVIGSMPARYLVFAIAGSLGGFMFPGRVPQTAPPFEMSASFAAYFLQGWAGVYLIWVVAGVLFDLWLRSQLNGSTPVVDVGTHVLRGEGRRDVAKASDLRSGRAEPWSLEGADASASLLDKLPHHIGREVVALEAEDHYVRVHTAMGNSLVFARFGDAMTALTAMGGVRVHRSFWVRPEAVKSVSVQGKGLLLTLVNGMHVPVSHGFREVAREAGIRPPSYRGSPSADPRVPHPFRAEAT